jgi:hypothetical protein
LTFLSLALLLGGCGDEEQSNTRRDANADIAKCEDGAPEGIPPDSAVAALRLDDSGIADPRGTILECVYLVAGNPLDAFRCEDGSVVYGVTLRSVVWLTERGATTKEPPTPVAEACEL